MHMITKGVFNHENVSYDFDVILRLKKIDLNSRQHFRTTVVFIFIVLLHCVNSYLDEIGHVLNKTFRYINIYTISLIL